MRKPDFSTSFVAAMLILLTLALFGGTVAAQEKPFEKFKFQE